MAKKWTLGDVANLAEIIAAVAIVVSLIYVGQELKSNTSAVQAASLQAITNTTSASVLSTAESEELADIRLRGHKDPTQLSEVERFRYVLFQRQMWLGFQSVWIQWTLGTVSDSVWVGYKDVICNNPEVIDHPDTWRETHASALSADFVALVDSCERPE